MSDRGFLVIIRDTAGRQVLGFADIEAVGIVDRHGDKQQVAFPINDSCVLFITTYEKEKSRWKRLLKSITPRLPHWLAKRRNRSEHGSSSDVHSIASQ